MNLPISVSTSAVSGVAKSLVRNVSDGLGKALDFDAILRGGGSAAAIESAVQTENVDAKSLRSDAVSRIRQVLAGIGVDANPGLTFGVEPDGQLRLSADHPRAAEIEMRLNENPDVRNSVRQWVATTGESQLSVGPA